jgi:hypothetical protein
MKSWPTTEVVGLELDDVLEEHEHAPDAPPGVDSLRFMAQISNRVLYEGLIGEDQDEWGWGDQ